MVAVYISFIRRANCWIIWRPSFSASDAVRPSEDTQKSSKRVMKEFAIKREEKRRGQTTGLDADLDLGLRGMHNRVSHIVHKRVLRKHVAQKVADCVVLVVQNECCRMRRVGNNFHRVLRGLDLHVKHLHAAPKNNNKKVTPSKKKRKERKGVMTSFLHQRKRKRGF